MGSTSNALIVIQNYSLVMENLGYDFVSIISIDLSEAFDRLRNSDIIEALRRMKPTFNPFVINVNFDSLEGRAQKVVFQGEISNSLPINQGAPMEEQIHRHIIIYLSQILIPFVLLRVLFHLLQTTLKFCALYSYVQLQDSLLKTLK